MTTKKRPMLPRLLSFGDAVLDGLHAYVVARGHTPADPRPGAEAGDDANHSEVIQGHEAGSPPGTEVSGDMEPIQTPRNVRVFIPNVHGIDGKHALIHLMVKPETFEKPQKEYIGSVIKACDAMMEASRPSDDEEDDE